MEASLWAFSSYNVYYHLQLFLCANSISIVMVPDMYIKIRDFSFNGFHHRLLGEAIEVARQGAALV